MKISEIKKLKEKPKWVNITGDSQLSVNTYYSLDATSADILTLPATPSENDFIQIYRNSGSSVGVTVTRNGKTIMGLVEDLEVDYEITSLHLVYNGTDWRIV